MRKLWNRTTKWRAWLAVIAIAVTTLFAPIVPFAAAAESGSGSVKTQEAKAGYQFKKIAKDTYAIRSKGKLVGYVLNGTEKSIIAGISGALSSIDAKAPVGNNSAIHLDLAKNTGNKTYNLGGRQVKAVALLGADIMYGNPYAKNILEDSLGLVDKTNRMVFTNEYIGNGSYFVKGNDNAYSDAGRSYYNVLNFQQSVRKVSALAKGIKTPAIYDGKGERIKTQYVKDMTELIDEVADFTDFSAVYEYDMTRPCANYIARNGSATLEFHIADNGYFGYLLMGTNLQSDPLTQAHYFVSSYNNGELYILRDTDVHTSYVYMDDKEAFMVDTGQYGGAEYAKRVKNLIGNRPLTVFITHAHGDHWFNLQYLDQAQIRKLYIGKDEEFTHSNEQNGSFDLETEIKQGTYRNIVQRLSDGEQFTAAGRRFEYVAMEGHTPHGGGLLDLTGRHFLSGDALGTQTYGGGTRITDTNLDTWISGVMHLQERLAKDNPADDIMAGHSAYPCDISYVSDMALLLNTFKSQGTSVLATVSGTKGGMPVLVAKNGHILSQGETDALFASNPTDEEALGYASISYSGNISQGGGANSTAAAKGTVETVTYHSDVLNQDRRFHIYLPAGYDGSEERFPVLYLLNGGGTDDSVWTEGGAHIEEVMDGYTNDHTAKKMIIVMPNVLDAAGANETDGNVMRDAFLKELKGSLVPYIDGNYRTLADRDHRAVAGFSFGGGVALWAALEQEDLFSYLGVFSNGIQGGSTADAKSVYGSGSAETKKEFIAKNKAFLKDAKKTNKLEHLIYIAVGKDDQIIGTGAKQLSEVLEKYGIRYVFRETDGGHTFENWMSYFKEFVPQLF